MKPENMTTEDWKEYKQIIKGTPHENDPGLNQYVLDLVERQKQFRRELKKKQNENN